ncbi:MAG: S9 family peptidase, partial [Bacteroidales bacterium]|nr:S9 family peptidase [Bacteroidales bacterium]
MKVTRVKYQGPLQIVLPVMVNNVDVNSKEFDMKSQLENAPAGTLVKNGCLGVNGCLGEGAPYINIGDIAHTGDKSLYCIEFAVSNQRYAIADIKVDGPTDYLIWLDGAKVSGSKLTLEPQTHTVFIKYIADSSTPAPQITLEYSKASGNACTGVTENTAKAVAEEDNNLIHLTESNLRVYTLKDAIHGTRYSGISISRNGKWLITGYSTTVEGGKSSSSYKITEVATGRVVMRTNQNISWMPESDLYYYVADGVSGREIIAGNPATGQESVFAENIPDGFFQISPDKKYLIYTLNQDGPQERKDVYEVLVPDDRQPGWRSRSYLAKYDLQTRQMQQITFGYDNCWSREVSN